MSRLRVRAFAKLNLSLEVLSKRGDGFHEVVTVMQSIGLADELLLDEAEGLSLACDDPELQMDDNLALRAARALLEASPEPRGATITLSKGIPAAAGLGGASADAAAVLAGLRSFWHLSLSEDQLGSVAASLGSDVPFFLRGGTALARGRGESIEPLRDLGESWFVILVPPHDLVGKTARLYQSLTPEQWTSGSRTLRLAEAIGRGAPAEEELLGNCFEGIATRLFPSLDSFTRAMSLAGARRVHLSGSGPAIYSVFEGEEESRAVARRLTGRGYSPIVARSLTSSDARPLPLPA